jgi:hypothetical protein
MNSKLKASAVEHLSFVSSQKYNRIKRILKMAALMFMIYILYTTNAWRLLALLIQTRLMLYLFNYVPRDSVERCRVKRMCWAWTWFQHIFYYVPCIGYNVSRAARFIIVYMRSHIMYICFADLFSEWVINGFVRDEHVPKAEFSHSRSSGFYFCKNTFIKTYAIKSISIILYDS